MVQIYGSETILAHGKESDGKVTRKYGIVDLGTLTWTYDTTTESVPLFRSSRISYGLTEAATVYICSKYAFVGIRASVAASDKSIGRWNSTSASNIVCIHDESFTDAATFKAAMSGVYLVYELATPTEEKTNFFTNPQTVYNQGTEEYIDNREVAIPVGHNTKYDEPWEEIKN